MAMDILLFRDLAFAALIFIITRRVLILFTLSSKRSALLPPGPRGWPVVGSLPLLGAMPHVALSNLAKTYGPIMYLKVGTCGMVVASTADAAKAFLKTLDTKFSNRPPNAGATHLGCVWIMDLNLDLDLSPKKKIVPTLLNFAWGMGGGKTALAYGAQDMVFADYGPRWKLLRKLCNLHMLGGKAIENWSNVRVLEVGHMVHAMLESSQKGEAVVVPEILTYAMANMIGQVILSRRVFDVKGYESNEFKDMVVELMTTAGYFNIGDCIPSISWMDLQGIEGGMKKLHKKFDSLLTKMIEEHERSSHDREGKPDFLDILLSHQENSDGEKLSIINIKALLLNLFAAGTDTSSSIIEWALAEMLKNPNILKQAHLEMDRVIGRGRHLLESDIPKLPYLQAICKETFRKHPSTPLNLPRVSSEACEVNGYYIPKNTRLSVNIWAIGRDPSVWENPLEFNPGRFLSGKHAKIEPKGNDFELIPFGAGRRICAGARMGIVLVEYILGTLVHSFQWELPNGVVELSMEEIFGLALQRAVPLSAMVTPRLSPELYA